MARCPPPHDVYDRYFFSGELSVLHPCEQIPNDPLSKLGVNRQVLGIASQSFCSLGKEKVFALFNWSSTLRIAHLTPPTIVSFTTQANVPHVPGLFFYVLPVVIEIVGHTGCAPLRSALQRGARRKTSAETGRIGSRPLSAAGRSYLIAASAVDMPYRDRYAEIQKRIESGVGAPIKQLTNGNCFHRAGPCLPARSAVASVVV